MAAPRRSDLVKLVLARHAHAVRVSKDELEDRRRQFLPVIIAEMPVSERGNWGLLLKTDKNPDFIPSDILVWRPTMEHIDVTSADTMPDDTRVIVPTWINHGVIGKTDGTRDKVGKWIWLDVKAANIPALPPPPGEGGTGSGGDEPGGDDDAELTGRFLAALDRIDVGLNDIHTGVRALVAVIEARRHG